MSFYAVRCIDPLTSSGEESWFFDGGSCLATDGLVQDVSSRPLVHQSRRGDTYVEFSVAKLPSSMGLNIQIPDTIPERYMCERD